MDGPDLFDWGAGRRARDEGMGVVADNAGAWMDWAETAVSEIAPGWIGSGQDLRLMVLGDGLPEPHHHNAWGALIRSCVKHGLIEWTGGLSQTRLMRSHARTVKVYRRL